MTAYEQHLLALAVEACRNAGLSLYILSEPGRFVTENARAEYAGYGGAGNNDALALQALLRDLGVEVPGDSPASAARKYITARGRSFDAWSDAYAWNAPAVLALLEGGVS